MIDFVHGDVLRWAAEYDGPKFHAALMDPPYELSFMGKHWDGQGISFRPETWAALGEHLLPGAFCMAFSGARTYHRMACAIEDAGFVLHSMIGWVYGSGFPKATRLDSQIDRAAGAERQVVGPNPYNSRRPNPPQSDICRQAGWAGDITAPATPLAATWSGHRYGLQALKPALEPICVFQKPYAGRPVDSITEYGAGALWIDGARVGFVGAADEHEAKAKNQHTHYANPNSNRDSYSGSMPPRQDYDAPGRWPSNLILDPCAAAALGRMSGPSVARPVRPENIGKSGDGTNRGMFGMGSKVQTGYYDESASTARFFQQADYALEQAEPMFYCAKASRRERDAGLEGMPLQEVSDQSAWAGVCNVCGCRMMLYGKPTCGHDDFRWEVGKPRHNPHPTVKPIALARYLATLLLPPAEYAPRRILVPFAGVGSEAIGAALAGWEDVTGIEAELEYVTMARLRAAHWLMQPAMQLEAAE